jgi:hypothetical protein
MRRLSAGIVLCFSMLSGVVVAQNSDSTVVPSLQFNWWVPSFRENGSVLPLAEIGGYVLRYRLKGAKAFRSIVIRGGSNKSYLLPGLARGTYDVEIATFDADGLYSKFVPVNYKLITPPSKPAPSPVGDVLGGKSTRGDGR